MNKVFKKNLNIARNTEQNYKYIYEYANIYMNMQTMSDTFSGDADEEVNGERLTEDRNAEEDTRQNAEEDSKGTARRRLLKISLSPDEFQVCSFRAQLAMTGGRFPNKASV